MNKNINKIALVMMATFAGHMYGDAQSTLTNDLETVNNTLINIII